MIVKSIKRTLILALFIGFFISTLLTGKSFAQTPEDVCPDPGTSAYANCISQLNGQLDDCESEFAAGSEGLKNCQDGVFEAYATPTNGRPLPVITVNTESCGEQPFIDRNILGVPVWYKYLNGERDVIIYEGDSPAPTECQPTLRNSSDNLDPNAFLAVGLVFIEIGFVLAGLVAVVMVIWGGFQFVLTQGEPDKAAAARKTVINAAVGLAIVLVATRVITFIATRITTSV